MKIALVLSHPSVDAPVGSHLSQWEQSVTDELLAAAGLKPAATFVASSTYFTKWTSQFENGKVGSSLIKAAEEERLKLHAALAGFDIALTLGHHAMYCLTGETKLDIFRGTHIDSPFVPGLQVVPTYSPDIYARAAWAERPVVFSAMKKALKKFEDVGRTIYVAETIQDLYDFTSQHIRDRIVFDVETNYATRITEFSLSTDSKTCLYVQLENRAHESFWSEADEVAVFVWLRELAQRPDLAWGFHNATYDLTYLDKYDVRPRGPIFDTMLRHHAWQPEWEKSLGFLASLHIPTRAWKHLRTQAKKHFNKAGAI